MLLKLQVPCYLSTQSYKKLGGNMKKRDAIAAFGSASELARALGIKRQSVSKWSDDIPELRAYQINEIIDQRRQDEGDTQ